MGILWSYGYCMIYIINDGAFGLRCIGFPDWGQDFRFEAPTQKSKTLQPEEYATTAQGLGFSMRVLI